MGWIYTEPTEQNSGKEIGKQTKQNGVTFVNAKPTRLTGWRFTKQRTKGDCLSLVTSTSVGHRQADSDDRGRLSTNNVRAAITVAEDDLVELGSERGEQDAQGDH